MLLPLGLACIWLGGAAWSGLVLLACAALAWEWAALCDLPLSRLPGAGMLCAVLLAVLVAASARDQDAAAVALAVLAAGAAALWLAPGRRVWSGLGALYLGVPAIALLWLRGIPGAGTADLLFLMLSVWASDIGAYAAGRLLGGPRLAPGISPGKTWSGAAGGLVAAALAGLCVSALADPDPSAGVLGRAALVSALLGAVSQAGDLGESALKRRFGVKDSGRLIPGHGGVLDRLDGVLAAAPVAALLALAGGGNGGGAGVWH